MNKRILGIACAILLCCQALRAQEAKLSGGNANIVAQDTAVHDVPRPKHEVYAGYGVLSFPSFVEVLTGVFESGATTKRGYGPVQVGYNYLLSENVSIGVLSSYTSFTARYDTGEIKYRHGYFCVMPRADAYWVRKENLLLYSGVAFGACAYRNYNGQTGETAKRPLYARHLNVFGMRVGKQTAFFTEFGYGFNGVVNMGVNTRF